MSTSDGSAWPRSLRDALRRISDRAATGALELEGSDRARRLFFLRGDLHLPVVHPLADRARNLLAAGDAPAVSERWRDLVERLADSLDPFGRPRVVFHPGLERLPPETIGPVPTLVLLRVLAGRDPESELAAHAGERWVASSGAWQRGLRGGWTPEEAWILERARQPATRAQLERESPVPREILRRAWAGLRAAGDLRCVDESGASRSPTGPDATRLVDILSERVAAGLRERPLALSVEEHRRRLAELLARAGGMNHYELLGLPQDAGVDAVGAAFEELARCVHPSHGQRLAAAEPRKALEFLFARATEAFRTLSDPALRVVYDATHGIAPPAIAPELDERAVEATRYARRIFERARSEEAQGDFHAALQLYGQAAETDPRAEYWAALGRLQGENPQWGARALESYRRALELDPQSADLRYAVGELLERAGDFARARSNYQAAANARPPHPAAPAAVARLGGDGARRGGGGFLGLGKRRK
jgi:tetratricopeptide (TPR) repeat protein